MFVEILEYALLVILLWILPAFLLIRNLDKARMRKWWYVFLALPVYIWIATIVVLVKASVLKKARAKAINERVGSGAESSDLFGIKKTFVVECPSCKAMVSAKRNEVCPRCHNKLPAFVCNKCKSRNVKSYNTNEKVMILLWSFFWGIGIVTTFFANAIFHASNFFIILVDVVLFGTILITLVYSLYYLISSKSKRCKCLDCGNDMHRSELLLTM